MSAHQAERTRPAPRTELYRAVEEALRQVQDPCAVALRTDWSLVDLGLLVDVYEGAEGDVVVELVLTDPLCPYYDRIEQMVVEAVSQRTGHSRVTMEISGEVAWDPSRLRADRPGVVSLPLLPARFRSEQ
jgi:metal-sulfur cluster biosynthetic enzyme